MTRKERMRKMLAMYKGDELLAIGTRYELAKQFSVKLSTIDWYRHTADKRQTGNTIARNCQSDAPIKSGALKGYKFERIS